MSAWTCKVWGEGRQRVRSPHGCSAQGMRTGAVHHSMELKVRADSLRGPQRSKAQCRAKMACRSCGGPVSINLPGATAAVRIVMSCVDSMANGTAKLHGIVGTFGGSPA